MGTNLELESGVNVILTLRTEDWEAHKGKLGSIRRNVEGMGSRHTQSRVVH